MAFGIASNIASTRAAHDLSQVASDSALRRNRLTSGLAINSGREGGAQLSTSQGMRAEISGLTQGTRNTEHALDLLRTAEGGMNEISAILIRMREMAVQSSSTTLNDNNRESLDAEFGQLKETIDRIVGLANYNEQALLRGFGNEVNTTLATAQTDAADTGVHRITLSAAKAGDYTFVDRAGDNEITLGNGVTTQTINLGSRTVDGEIATGTPRSSTSTGSASRSRWPAPMSPLRRAPTRTANSMAKPSLLKRAPAAPSNSAATPSRPTASNTIFSTYRPTAPSLTWPMSASAPRMQPALRWPS